jgi:DNA-binding NarL/FixJ family response regulator
MMVTQHAELFSEQDWTRLKEEPDLPPRQAEILRYVFDGMSDKQIARAIGISFGTVRAHLSRLFDKFGSHDRVELIRRCVHLLWIHLLRNENAFGTRSI